MTWERWLAQAEQAQSKYRRLRRDETDAWVLRGIVRRLGVERVRELVDHYARTDLGGS